MSRNPRSLTAFPVLMLSAATGTDSRIRGLVLLRAATSLRALSTFVSALCAVLRTRQPIAGSSAQIWPPGYGGSRRKETGSEARQLVDRRAGASSFAGTRLRAREGQTGSGASWVTARLRTSAPRTRGLDWWPSSVARRALGNCRPVREGWSRSNRSRSRRLESMPVVSFVT